MALELLPLRWGVGASLGARKEGHRGELGGAALLPRQARTEGLAATAQSLAGRRLAAAPPSRRPPSRKARGAALVCEASAAVPPTVSDTKAGFLSRFKRPIPSLYNSVIQELIVQQHLTRYNTFYKYDPIFALGFVTVFDQLMDGYPYSNDAEKIFQAYIEALGEDPQQYRRDAKQLEEWAQGLSSDMLVSFAQREGPVESLLKDIAGRAGGGQGFHYSRFFAIGLFRLLELAGASEPATLEALCAALQVPKLPVDRDLDTYRGLLNKLTQAKDMLRDFTDREAKKKLERESEKQAADEASAKEKVEKAELGEVSGKEKAEAKAE